MIFSDTVVFNDTTQPETLKPGHPFKSEWVFKQFKYKTLAIYLLNSHKRIP